MRYYQNNTLNLSYNQIWTEDNFLDHLVIRTAEKNYVQITNIDRILLGTKKYSYFLENFDDSKYGIALYPKFKNSQRLEDLDISVNIKKEILEHKRNNLIDCLFKI